MEIVRQIKHIATSPAKALFALLALLPFLLIAAGCGDVSDAKVAKPRRPQPKVESHWSDSDRDGIPAGAELSSATDREHFREWFTGIAEWQFYEPNAAWNPEQRDCSGLVRFAWREALKRHDHEWLQKMGPHYELFAPDVAAYDLEHGMLREKIFRTDDGVFKEADVSDGSFAEFADARSLKSFNTTFVSRDRRDAEPGDLLFYYQPWVQKYHYHVMIFLGEPREASEGESDWVVYHTGSSPVDKGTIKKVRLGVLDKHPDPRWRPLETNKNFLGFYRLRILN
jgi:uncharacterized protein YfaT (DUF1175 family)